MARDRIRDLTTQKADFLIESNLAKASDYTWICLIRKAGYRTVLFFLGTSDVDINKRRVLQRVIEGGHGVPERLH
jgi:predicted ABC-type ATPase